MLNGVENANISTVSQRQWKKSTIYEPTVRR